MEDHGGRHTLRRTEWPAKAPRGRTVDAWMTAVVEFYKWAEASAVIEPSLSGLVYEPRYIAAGMYGGEQGRIRQVPYGSVSHVRPRAYVHT